jgi:transposase
VELSRGARVRLAWMDFHRRTKNVTHTCRHFGISRQTFYRWQRRYDPYDLTSLEERSHRPRQCRQPTWAFSFDCLKTTPGMGRTSKVSNLTRFELQSILSS